MVKLCVNCRHSEQPGTAFPCNACVTTIEVPNFVNSSYDKKYDLKDVVINHESYEEILEAIDEFMEIYKVYNKS